MTVLKELETALKRIIPISSLPMNYPDHSILAAELVIELDGKLVLMEKQEYELHLRRMGQAQRAERAIIRGVKGEEPLQLKVNAIHKLVREYCAGTHGPERAEILIDALEQILK